MAEDSMTVGSRCPDLSEQVIGLRPGPAGIRFTGTLPTREAIRAATYRLTFRASGHVYSGPDATAVLKQLTKAQWDPTARRNVKASLAWRAWILTRTPVDEDADDDTFLRAFADTGLATLEVNSDDNG